ncbi:MAG: 3'(2'),5'-bisphosphate nucleotidase CysQ [Alphaproteobacteria bacterium]
MPEDRAAKLLTHPEALCNMVRRIALEAGEIAMRYYDGLEDMQVDIKYDDSPVTLADRETEAFIQAALEQLTPAVPFVGEEAAALGRVKAVACTEYFWLVDPIDGTKDFINGSDEFTVNIALVKQGVPVLGVIYAPAKGELFAAHGPRTAIRWLEDTDNEKRISVRPVPKNGLTVVSSKHYENSAGRDEFLERFKIEKIVKKSSSLKICAIAMGRADIYPRFGPTCEWDTAAGDAILRAAGGAITDINGAPLQYGGANPKWLNPEFVAASFEWFGSE